MLIVDDELLVRRSLQRVCASRGHEIAEAEDGQAGLDLWRSWDPDLVFLDVLMPKMTGLEVLQTLGPENTARVILMSAYSGTLDDRQAQNAGADLFLSKPFPNIFSVVEQAEELWRGSGRRKEG